MERKPIFDAIRTARGKGFAPDEVTAIDALLDKLETASDISDLPWIVAARSKLGTREIPGPQSNSWIVDTFHKLGATWYNGDDTPWCASFVGWCMQEAGLPTLGWKSVQAKAWADYGMALNVARYGCIGVKSRTGGGHVFFIVGETPDKRFYKALGGNQGNMVSIVDIAKSDVMALRWPPGTMVPNTALPVLPKGTTGASEA